MVIGQSQGIQRPQALALSVLFASHNNTHTMTGPALRISFGYAFIADSGREEVTILVF